MAPIDTPAFMPVGTAGTVKAMTADAVRATGAQMVLGNTYHLMLRPGAERVAALGGLHRMMDWPGPILTDSGGFQVMSLAALRQIDAEGVTFRSHLDGSAQRLTPGARDADPARARRHRSPWCSTSARSFPPPRTRRAPRMELSMRWAARSQGCVRAAPGLRAVRHRPGRRAIPDLRARLRRRAGRASASTATRSAGSRWARGRRRCSRCWTRRCRCCRPTGRAT